MLVSEGLSVHQNHARQQNRPNIWANRVTNVTQYLSNLVGNKKGSVVLPSILVCNEILNIKLDSASCQADTTLAFQTL